ncbi:hypothetical protein M3Y94_01165800 [Aphelenchoides besseyi]|nr:hypothetical protein M3Y94_01165800 [Aphelenchoides besseyi]KAI6228107.1 hypothetical protein M3Y95_00587400 [Aphelenchoides besseyi]
MAIRSVDYTNAGPYEYEDVDEEGNYYYNSGYTTNPNIVRQVAEPRNPSFRMVSNLKHRIFVVKSGNNSVRLIQRPAMNTRPQNMSSFGTDVVRQNKQNVDWYSRSDEHSNSYDYRSRYTNDLVSTSPTTSEIKRSAGTLSSLMPVTTDSEDDKAVKQILNGLINEVSETEQEKKYGNWRSQDGSTDSPARRVCGFRNIEPEMLAYTDRIRQEIIKRRHRIETECANSLGLVSPWRRTRFRKPVSVEDRKTTALVNPNEISLHSIAPSNDDTSNFDFSLSPYESIGRRPCEEDQMFAEAWVPSLNDDVEIVDQRTIKVGQSKKGEKRKNSNSSNSTKKMKTENVERCHDCSKTFDSRRFSVQCSECFHRYHGKCVAMSEKKLKKLGTPWVCNDCVEKKSTKQKVDLLCVCRKPYNANQFYVGCDGCQNWFHPSCVGTTQAQVEATEAAYICPSCRSRPDIKRRFKVK